MRISPVTNYNYSKNNTANSNVKMNKPLQSPAFKGLHDDDDLFQGPARGYSILDLFKSKKPKITKEDEEEVLENWDPDLGDISDIIAQNTDENTPSLEELMKRYEEGTLYDDDDKKKEQPPSIFNYQED